MVNKKIKMNEKNSDGTFNILHPETTIEQVINPNGENIVEHFSDKTKKHIEIVDEIPLNLEGKGIFLKKQGVNDNAPNKPTIQDLYDKIENIENTNDDKDRVLMHFIKSDYDGGDCSLIQLPTGENILTDTHIIDDTISIVVPYLKSKSVAKLDYIILSHYHHDHVGGIRILAENFEIGTLILGHKPDFTHNYFASKSDVNDMYNLVMTTVNEYSLDVYYPTENQVFEFEKAKFTFFNTECSQYYNTTSDYNNFSMCYVFQYGQTKSFFCGDIDAEAQNFLVEIIPSCDIYKIEHHGYNEFIVDGFLEKLNPKLGIAQTNATHVGSTYKWLRANGRQLHATIGKNIVVELSNYNYQILEENIRRNVSSSFSEFTNMLGINFTTSGLFPPIAGTQVNANLLTETGIYRLSDTALNMPPNTTNTYVVLVFKYFSTYNRILQFAALNDANAPKLYYRYFGNDSVLNDAKWSAWITIV